MTRLWLIGMMGTGKTSAGRSAAGTLGVGFADTDELVADHAGSPVSEVWASAGESAFREMERKCLGNLGDFRGIVATGGGAVLDESNREMIQGRVVWLQARPATIVARLGESDRARPLLAGPGALERRVAAILKDRALIYQALATHRLATDDREIDDVADEIARIWNG